MPTHDSADMMLQLHRTAVLRLASGSSYRRVMMRRRWKAIVELLDSEIFVGRATLPNAVVFARTKEA